MASQILERRDVWTLQGNGAWDPITVAYARAVTLMQDRPANDPTSWIFQASIHHNDCQHWHWYFLPWHRMYLWFFERIVRAAVQLDGGPADFALPYWNYDAPPPRSTLPRPFREPALPDGSENPLYLAPPLRDPALSAGGALPPSATSSQSAMNALAFSLVGGVTSFGGGPESPSHIGESQGLLENNPHGAIHSLVGGRGRAPGVCSSALMGNFRCAALDPIFWLHHANIDRLWQRWLALGDGRRNPEDEAWLNQTFRFFDENGNPVTMTCAQVQDTVSQLGYRYDDAQIGLERGAAPRRVTAMNTPRRSPPELAAATQRGFELTGQAKSVSLTVPSSTRALLAAAPDTTQGKPMYLSVEDIEGTANPGVVYEVYLTVTPATGAPTRQHVGNVSFFGIEEMNEPDRDHRGMARLRHTFEVTEAVKSLQQAGSWDPSTVEVTFEPLMPLLPPDASGRARAIAPQDQEVATEPVRIGRVSLFVG